MKTNLSIQQRLNRIRHAPSLKQGCEIFNVPDPDRVLASWRFYPDVKSLPLDYRCVLNHVEAEEHRCGRLGSYYLDGAGLIADERAQQIQANGWTPQHDDLHDRAELAKAAVCYALPRNEIDSPAPDSLCTTDLISRLWPWNGDWRKKIPSTSRIKELTIAGALIAAEIDRLQRLEKQSENEKTSSIS